MKIDNRDKIALFRYGIIAPLVTDTLPDEIVTKASYFKYASLKTYTYYNGEDITISANTIKKWYLDYLKGGFDALKPKKRSDTGFSRKLDNDIKDQIIHLKQEHPRMPATVILQKLFDNSTVTKKDVSLATVNRFINASIIKNKIPSKEFRSYEKEFINEVWYGDTSYGPYVNKNGKKTRTYIIALIDDASRLIVGYGIFFEDNYINLMQVMKKAVSKYGKPNMFSFDNGANYRNRQMELLAARLGVVLNYAPPYTPQSKAKIERWFRTLKDQCLSNLSNDDKSSIENFTNKASGYIDEYNNRVHTSLNGLSPIDRFFKDSSKIIRMSEEKINNSFLLEVTRKVSRDNIIKLNNDSYEVDYQYCNKHVIVRHSPDLSTIYIVLDDGKLEPLKLLNKIGNGSRERKRVKLSEDNE